MPMGNVLSITEAKQASQSLQEHQPENAVRIEDYQPYIRRGGVARLQRLAERVSGRGWTNINSTLQGGGVAEMLRSVIPLARSLGIDAHWYAMQGRPEFFQVTKKLHNLLQGVEQPISVEELLGEYLGFIEEKARETSIHSDMIVVHDPQPLALTAAGVLEGSVLWRCHIDTSAPNPLLWRFLLPYINQCSGAIFTQPQFAGPGLRTPAYQIFPCIDPLAEKNRRYSEQEAREILAPLFHEHNVDPERPILAAVSRYDLHKNQLSALKAFRRLRKERTYKRPPYLIFLGNTATDDPEGGAILELLKGAADDPDIRFWVDVPDNDRVVGSLMQIARGFIHVPTREGFGLVVSEAMWQGTPVIGSTAGGITQQVLPGKTGYLVDPRDVAGITARMAQLLDDADRAEALGRQAQEHVRQNFLLPELVSRYLVLLRHFCGVSRKLPPFRINLSFNGNGAGPQKGPPSQAALPGTNGAGTSAPPSRQAQPA